MLLVITVISTLSIRIPQHNLIAQSIQTYLHIYQASLNTYTYYYYFNTTINFSFTVSWHLSSVCSSPRLGQRALRVQLERVWLSCQQLVHVWLVVTQNRSHRPYGHVFTYIKNLTCLLTNYYTSVLVFIYYQQISQFSARCFSHIASFSLQFAWFLQPDHIWLSGFFSTCSLLSAFEITSSASIQVIDTIPTRRLTIGSLAADFTWIYNIHWHSFWFGHS